MHPSTALSFGIVIGLFIAALLALGALTRYVSSDVGAFVKWLDRAEPGEVAP